ncbi:MAG: ATP-grasp domain-containing protein [Cyanobacteria bacterium P01_C01_bin.121]
MPTLVLTPRFTEDSQALWRSAIQLGWQVERLKTWRIPERLKTVSDPVLYVEALFGPTLAEQLGIVLSEPPNGWLASLPNAYKKRQVSLMSMGEARQLTEPAFIKPPNDKSFPAKVYVGSQLSEDYDDHLPVLVAEIVSWEKEFRCFVLEREPQAISVYLRGKTLQRDSGFNASESELCAAEEMVKSVLADATVDIPKAAVLDVGVITHRGWAVVEMNSVWGAGIYGCDPKKVLEVLKHSMVP